MCISSCKPLEIIKAEKQKVVSGRPQGILESTFSTSFKVNKPITLDSILLNNTKNAKSYQTFELYNLLNGKILKPNAILTKGTYFINIANPEISINSSTTFSIHYTSNGNSRSSKGEIIPQKKLLMKTKNSD